MPIAQAILQHLGAGTFHFACHLQHFGAGNFSLHTVSTHGLLKLEPSMLRTICHSL